MKHNGISLAINNKALINWKQIWQNTFKAYNIPYENNLYYKLLHRMLTKKHDNAKRKNNVSQVCERYNKTLIHVFYHCKNRKKYGKL